jgi:hypothetical protein
MMIDFKKLNSQLDINNIDVARIVRTVGEHRNVLINVVLIIGSLLIAGAMFNSHSNKDLRSQISQLQQKIGTIKARGAAIRDFNDFKSSLPKKVDESGLITLISDYAKIYHVKITSLAPAESRDMGLYDAVNANFNAVSDNFKNVMLFLRKIEKSKFPLRVNSWSGYEDRDGRITFAIEVSAVLIHT